MTLIQVWIAIIIVFVLIISWLIFRGRVESHEKQIRNSLPDALDLLTVMIEAGMSLDGAMNEVGERLKGPLGEEFAHAMRDIQGGPPRQEALHAMAQRTKVPDVATLVDAIEQSESMGTDLADVLRFQASELRRVRRERAQRRANVARTKMLLPMVAFIFPTIWIVILGPAIPIVINSLAHLHLSK